MRRLLPLALAAALGLTLVVGTAASAAPSKTYTVTRTLGPYNGAAYGPKVRDCVPDDEFAARFGDNQSAETNPKLAAVTLAFCALGKQMTGLPIDFQIQSVAHANGSYGDQIRSALIEVRTP